MMRIPTTSTAGFIILSLAIPFAAAGWFLTVPGVLTPSTFAALLGLLAAFMWVATTTFLNWKAPGFAARRIQ